MATLPILNNLFATAITVTKQNNTKITLNTINTFVDKNIELTANVQSATTTLSTNAAATISSIAFNFNTTNNNFNVTGSSAITGTATLGITRSGWLESSKTTAISGTAVLNNVTVPKIGINTIINGSGARKPTISNQSVPSGVTNAATGTATIIAPSSGIYVAVQSEANTTTITAIPGVSSAGYGTVTSGQYTATNATATVGASASDITYIPIKIGSINLAPVNATQNFTISINTATGAVSGNYTKTVTTTATVTPGWITSGTNNNVTISGSGSLNLGIASFANTATSGVTYTDISTTAPVLVSGDYLYINKGYTNNTKISLAKLVPDSASAQLADAHILSGYSAYNNDGVLIAGSIPTKSVNDLIVNGPNVTAPAGYYASNVTTAVASGSVSVAGAGSATIGALNYGYDSVNTRFTVTATTAILGTATATVSAGYISSSKSASLSGSASVSTTVARISGTTSFSGDKTQKPIITRTNTSATNAINVGSGDATTTKPTSGYFVSVKSDAKTSTLTATPSITTAGYGTSTYHNISGNNTAVGAAASDETYIVVPSGSVEVPYTSISVTPSISINASGLITASVSATQIIAPEVTAGYVIDGTSGTASVQGSNTSQLTTKGETTYNVSTSDQTIVAGTYLTGKQTFRKVTTSGIDAGNIKFGTTVTVGDSGSDTRIKNVTGTFTKANTVSSGQTAAAAAQILSGYSAWVDATEVKGNIASKNSNNIIVDSIGNSITVQPGYYATTATKSLSAGSVIPSFSNSGLSTYFSTTSTSGNLTITPNYTSSAGYIGTNSTAVNGTSSYYNIKTTSRSASTGYVTLTAGSGSAVFAIGTGDSENSNNTSLQVLDSTPSSGVYYTLSLTGSGTVSGIGCGVVNTGEGWISSGSTTSNNSSSASKTSNTTTLTRYIVKSVHGNAVSGSLPSSISGRTSGTYVDLEIQPKGYLKIPAGYSPIDRYIYANVADVSSEARSASGFSLNVSSISGSDTVTVGTLTSGYYPVIANNLSVTATLSASTTGWFSSGSAKDDDTDNVTVGKMAAAVASVTGSTTASSPRIARSTTAVSGATNVANGDATTTTPGSGSCYVAIQATAPATTISLTKTVSTKGYLDNNGQISASASTIAKTGSLYFVPIAKATTTTSNGTASATATAGTASVITAPSATATATYSSGGITNGISTDSTGYYITIAAAATANSGVIEATGGGAGAKVTASNITVTPGYVTATATISTSASDTGSKTGSTTRTTAASATNSQNKTIYFKKAAIAGSITNASAITTVAPGTVSITKGTDVSGKTKVDITPTTDTSAISTYYIPIKATAAANSTGITSSISGSGNATVSTEGYAPANLTGSISISGTATAKTSSKDSNNYVLPLPTASPGFSGGAISGSVTNITGSNVTLSDTNNGISVSGSASAGRGAVTYSSAVTGWLVKSSGATAYAGTSSNTTLTSKTKYITGITVPKDVAFSLTSVADTALDTTSDITITNGEYRQLKITNNGSATITSGSISSGSLIVAAYTSSSATATTSKTIVTNGIWKTTTASNSGTYYGRVKVGAGDYRADLSINQNSTVTPSINLHTNATATYGFTTTTPSSGSNGTDFLTIDPNASATQWSVTPKAKIITAGYLVVEDKTGAAIASTPSIAAGTNYYVPIIKNIQINGGGLTVNTNTNVVSTIPKVTVSSAGTFKTTGASSYGVTTTEPSGTDGTNYLTIDGFGEVSTIGIASSSVKMSRSPITYSNDAGVIAAHTNMTSTTGTSTTTGTTVNITPSITDSFSPLYIPITTVSVSGGGLTTDTNTNTVSTTPVVTVSSSGTFKSASSYGVTTTKPSGTDGTNYLTIDGSGTVTTTGVASSSVKMSRATITYTNSAGAIVAHSGTTGINGTSATASKTVNITPSITDSFSPLYIPITTVSVSGGGLSIGSNYSNTATVSLDTGSETNMDLDRIQFASKDTATYPYFFKVNCSSSALSGNTRVDRDAITYKNNAGAIIAHNNTSVSGSTSASPTVTIKSDSKSKYFGIKAAAITVTKTSGSGSCSYASGSSANVTVSDTDTDMNSGVKIVFTGSGKVTAQANVTAAGYRAAANNIASGANLASGDATATKYITGVTLTKPSSGIIRKFNITVPNGSGSDTITFQFQVDSDGNVTIGPA